jgi:hypothetical protein
LALLPLSRFSQELFHFGLLNLLKPKQLVTTTFQIGFSFLTYTLLLLTNLSLCFCLPCSDPCTASIVKPINDKSIEMLFDASSAASGS